MNRKQQARRISTRIFEAAPDIEDAFTMSSQPEPRGQFLSLEKATVEALPGKTHYWYCRPDLVHTGKLNFVRARLPAGQGHDFHHHPGMEEILYILDGQAEQWIEREKRMLGPGEGVHIPKGLVHATFNAGENTLDFLALLAPADFAGPMTVEKHDEEPWRSLRGAGGLNPTTRSGDTE